MKKLKYKIYPLGCKVNQYDAGTLSGGLASSGFKMVEKGADLAVIYSCAVTGSAISKSRQAVTRAKRENPKAKIVLTGCWPKIYREDSERSKVVDLVLAKGSLEDILCTARDIYGFTSHSFCGQILNKNQDRSGRYFLKIQDGCEQFCSYCIIPYARGPLSSRLSEEVIEEAKAAVAAGFKEIVLSGIHLGLYGVNNVQKDKTERGMKLYKLIEQLELIDGLKKIRLSSIEINEVSNGIINLLEKKGKLCPHLHIPLQSGCDKILKLMKRPYSLDFFAKRLAQIRQVVPNIAITTDVIVGFPGESETDFKKTISFIGRENFSRLHVFSFSAHPRVPAASLPGQVSEGDKKNRASRLRSLNEKLVSAYRRRFVGKRIELVVEAVVDGRIKGKSGYYFDVWFLRKDILSANKNKKNLVGELVEIKMKK